MSLPERVQAAVFAAVIVGAATGLILAAQALRPQPRALDRGIELAMEIDGPGWTLSYSNAETRNNTVFLFLLEASGRLHFALEWTNWSPPYAAVFVDAINGAQNGDGGRWWVFWVDGGYGTMAADLTALQDGQTVLWRFTTPEGG